MPSPIRAFTSTSSTCFRLTRLFSPVNSPRRSFHSTSAIMTEKATFAAGCFWGVEKAFQKHYKNESIRTAVGYTGGTDPNPTYKKVCSSSGTSSNHAEALQIEYTPNEKIHYAELVEFFYRMHDPTTLDSQGPDRGTQYRSAIFYHSPEQETIAREVTAKVQDQHYKGKKIVTQILKAGEWHNAEDYHQKYLDKNPHGYECPSHFLRW